MGARVWVKDPSRVWITATVTDNFDGKTLKYETEDLTKAEITVKNDVDLPHLRNPDVLIGVNDLTHLSYLHEPAVLHNLAERFIRKQSIYTYCGIVLVAINPYEELPLYGNETISMYRGRNMGDLDPHIYAVAEEAFAKMERDNRDQSIIVSGESGAGKTVSAKYAMRYFATVGGTSQTETQIEKRVLASSPIMEAIGNAKTTRNDNSSRFGKYIEIDFNTSFQIIGANMRTYLLEKSRVVFQAAEERNYHIFYQMCAARDFPELEDLHLAAPGKFHYMNQGDNPIINGVDDQREFVQTKEAFKMLGFSEREQNNIFRILAGILHLGNIKIEPGSGRSDSESSMIPQDDLSLKLFANLLQIKEEQMRKWLCNKRIVTVRDSYDTPMNAKAAIFARDALAKCIYAYLFDWIVVQINKALRTSGKVHKFIGVLDIYGFETFEVNSFEQFCINYANEKLQQQFNQHVFKLEQEEYLKEGIEWKMIDFYDNQPCIDLIESKLGILDLLDEECKMPKGSDKSWVEKLYDKCKKWEHFSKPRLSQTAFMVKHFADNVEYECNGFLDKNRDTVMEEQIQILKASDNDLVSDLFLEGSVDASNLKPGKAGTPLAKKQSGGGSTKQNKKTVGSQFRDSLNLLMQALNCTTPHYVRCIKPNDSKVAFEFDPKRAVQQLRACGVLETVRISAAGYPSRWTYYDFYTRYRVLCRSKDVARNDFRTTCTNIIAKLIKDEDKYQFGKNKLFFRAGQVAYLEKLRSEKLRDCGVMIQKHVKGWLYRKKYQQIRTATVVIQKWVRGFLSRRRVRHLRRTSAAIVLQTRIRGWVKRTQYRRVKARTILLQARIRGFQARQKHLVLLRNSKAVIIQSHVRGFIQRRKYQRKLRQIILAQSKVRQFLARRQFKRLKIEAKSIEHQKKLNKGLENKIISLQQRLTETEKSLTEMKKFKKDHSVVMTQLEELKASEAKNKTAISRVEILEREIEELKKTIEHEKSEKVDLLTERDREIAAWKELQASLRGEVASLTSELEATKQETSQKNQLNFEELSQKHETEMAAMHSEYEQDRIAYQKLLKTYNKLEIQYENIQDELRHAKGEDLMSNASISASMLSVDFPDEESAYGSNSGRSSARSGRGDGEGHDVDVGLTIKLQQKLNKTQQLKEKLEKRVEELEATLTKYKTQQVNIADTLKLQDFEIENAKLKEDLKRLRSSVAEGYHDDSQIQEVLEQYEHLQEELERKQEECVQLRTVLSSMSSDSQPLSILNKISEMPVAEEIYPAYETLKNVLGQLQKQMAEEKDRAKENEIELRREIEELSRTCSEQQLLIYQAINKSPANNTEACLQHEIQRLTGENFDLREKIENMNESNKHLKKLLKAYMKKLNDVGAPVPELEPEIAAPPVQLESLLPMVRKKASDFLGMFEYKKEQEQQILRALIYDLKPKVAAQMLPGLPAYIFFMMIRYTDYINNDDYVRSLIQGAISMIKKVVKKKSTNDLELKILWLSNLFRILNNLKQYSGEKQFQNESTLKQIEQCLRHFDLSEYRRVLSDIAIWIYQGITKLIEEEIQPVLVLAILEHEGIGGMSGNDSSKRAPLPPPDTTHSFDNQMDAVHIEAKEALTTLLKHLNRFYTVLTKHGMDPDIIAQIFKQIFYFICAGSLNNLLLRKDMCHWSRGMQIRYNLAQIEQWARDKKIHDERTQAIDAFMPLIQAAQLLQARKSEDDAASICEMCDRLKPAQIVKILNLYTPNDEFEERVTPGFVRKIQAKLRERVIAEPPVTDQSSLLMDTKFTFAVKFPFYPSTIQLEELEIPEFYNNLQVMLKKI